MTAPRQIALWFWADPQPGHDGFERFEMAIAAFRALKILPFWW